MNGFEETAKKAVGDIEKAIDFCSTDSFLYFCLAGLRIHFVDDASLADSDIQRGESLHTFLVYKHPVDSVFYIPRIYMKTGWELNNVSKGNNVLKEKARIYIDRAIELDGNDCWYYYYRYHIYSEGTDLELHDLNSAIELGYEYADFYGARAIIRERNQDYHGAIQDYERELELFEDQREPIRYDNSERNWLHQRLKARAILKFKINDIKSGIEDFNSAFKYGGYSFDDFQELINRLCDLKYYNEVINECISQINWRGGEGQDLPDRFRSRLIKELPKCYELRAKAKEIKGDMKGAQKDYETSITLTKDNGN